MERVKSFFIIQGTGWLVPQLSSDGIALAHVEHLSMSLRCWCQEEFMNVFACSGTSRSDVTMRLPRVIPISWVCSITGSGSAIRARQ